MKVYEISPIIKYSPFFSLTYFSKFDFEVGNIVEVEINKKKVLGVVQNTESLKDAKRDLRNAKFQSKKIENQKVFYSFPEKCFSELQKTSILSGVSIGEVLNYIEFDGTPPLLGKERSGEISYFPDEFSAKVGGGVSGQKIFKILQTENLNKIIIKDFNFEKYINFQNPHLNKLEIF